MVSQDWWDSIADYLISSGGTDMIAVASRLLYHKAIVWWECLYQRTFSWG